jgi:hybrid cluster-associated redox disulfide protein
MKTINRKMLIGDIIDKYPELAEVLVSRYGLHCIGCMGAAMETLEDGATAHGMSTKEIGLLEKDLNGLISK